VQLNEFCLKGVLLRRIIRRGQRPEYKRDCAASPPRTRFCYGRESRLRCGFSAA
jgi:hypothetical protein